MSALAIDAQLSHGESESIFQVARRLEPVLHLELAGHSGPSDWVFMVIWAIVAIALFLMLRSVLSSPKSKE